MPATGPATNHAAADRCPGVLRLTEAADGYLARVRLPGGLIGAGPMRMLARLASELGDGRVELTSRGNVQLRGLAADAAAPLTADLARAGLFPSPEHDRVRNVLASPLAGLDGGPDLTAVVQALDAGLCARPRLAELPGRFLFAVDDGRGDVAGLGADVVAQMGADGAVVNGLAVRGVGRDRAGTGHAGRDHIGTDHAGTDRPAAEDVVTVMLACAEAFLDLRAAEEWQAWRISDLADGAERVRAAVSRASRAGRRPRAASRVPRRLRLADVGRVWPPRPARRCVRPVGDRRAGRHRRGTARSARAAHRRAS